MILSDKLVTYRYEREVIKEGSVKAALFYWWVLRGGLSMKGHCFANIMDNSFVDMYTNTYININSKGFTTPYWLLSFIKL